MFVDMRLHVSTRTSLEYTLPEAGSALRSVLLGDLDAKTVLAPLTACADGTQADTSGDTEADDDDDETEGTDLRRCVEHALPLLEEHLQRMSAQWTAHLRSLRADVRCAVQDVQRALRNQSRRPGAPLRLSTEFEERLATLRAQDAPWVTRDAELVRACECVQRTFAESYGSIRTRRIVHHKARFERALRSIEDRTAREFLLFATDLLRT